LRDAYLSTLYSLARDDRNVMALVGDNGTIVYDKFRASFPDQFLNCGIAEATMVAVAAGLASCGKIPFVYTIIPFLTMRAYEQVKNDVCLQKQNVKLVGIGAGFVYSALGPTHHAIEDLAIMRVLPNMTILSPASPLEAQKATRAAAMIKGPVYLRLGTSREPEIYQDDYDFEIGRAVCIQGGTDVTIVATGSIVYDALQAAISLRNKHISARVINMHTIKPLDIQVLLEAARETNAIVTVEEHSVIGGLAEAVSSILLDENPYPVVMGKLGLDDFCHGYGQHQDLKALNGLSAIDIEKKVINVYQQKLERLRGGK